MKMSLDDLKSFYKPVMVVPGNPDTLTGATRKNHIHGSFEKITGE